MPPHPHPELGAQVRGIVNAPGQPCRPDSHRRASTIPGAVQESLFAIRDKELSAPDLFAAGYEITEPVPLGPSALCRELLSNRHIVLKNGVNLSSRLL